MIHHELLEHIKQEKQRGSFIYPFYERYSLAEFPHTVLSIFGIPQTREKLHIAFPSRHVNGIEKVVVLFVDGLSYKHFLDAERQLPLFKRLSEKGEVFPLTTVYPSTTAAALTTVHTGLTPQEHGLPEWLVYFEELNQAIFTLPFMPLSAEEPNSLLSQGGRPEMLYEGTTIYETLAKSGVKPFIFLSEEYAQGAYTKASQRGAEIVPCRPHIDVMQKLKEKLSEKTGPAYYFVYWPDIDTAGHVYSPESEEYRSEISLFSHLFLAEFLEKVDKEVAEKTLLLLTSDHGQVPMQPNRITYLNKNTNIMRSLQEGKSGNVIPPTGSPRDVFLFVKPLEVQKTMEELRKLINGNGEVISTRQAINRGLFGIGRVSERFQKRIGNVHIMPEPGSEVWYEHRPGERFSLLGHHGGLSEEEMIIPFAISRLSALLLQ